MSKKILGILTPIGIIVLSVIVAIITSIIVSQTSSDGWAALGALIMVFMLTGVVYIVLLIVSIVVYTKKKSQYALGILYGIMGLAVFGILSSVLISVYNLIVG